MVPGVASWSTHSAFERYPRPVGNPRDAKTGTVIGWREWVALPQLGVDTIKAKVDTGARSSSLHAFDVHELEEAGVTYVAFKVHPIQRETRTTIEARAELRDLRVVRNPGGREELRPVIVTKVALGGRSWAIELTLTRRDAMGFRMLLGRQAVRGKFVVDPGRSYLTGGPPGRGAGKPKRRGEREGDRGG